MLMNRAHAAVRKAVRDGVLFKPESCEHCGRVGYIHGHHHNGYESGYELDVVWLCPRCHKTAEKAMPLVRKVEYRESSLTTQVRAILRKYTPAEIHRKTGLAKSYIFRIREGHSLCGLESLDRIMRGLNEQIYFCGVWCTGALSQS